MGKSAAAWTAVAALGAGCQTYAGPPAHPEPPTVATPTCVVGIVMAEQHYEAFGGMDTQATAAELIAALRTLGWFRAVDHVDDLAEPADHRIRVSVRQGMFNEPYILVMTLGVIPNPIVSTHGFDLTWLDPPSGVVRRINTTYPTEGWVGWFTPLIALLPNQYLFAPPAELHTRYFGSRLAVDAPELLEPCG